MDLQKQLKRLQNPEEPQCSSINEYKISLNEKVVHKTTTATIKEIAKELKDTNKNNQKIAGLEIKNRNQKLEARIMKDREKQFSDREKFDYWAKQLIESIY